MNFGSLRPWTPSAALVTLVVTLAGACSATTGRNGFTGTEGSGGATTAQGTANTASTGNATNAGTGGSITFTTASSTSTGTGSASCPVTDPNADMDHDGWTPAQGDCNDCDPNVNPGAVDVAGDPNKVDSDCSGTYDPPKPCDTGLALDDVNPIDGAKSIELCQFTTEKTGTKDKTWIWGVTDAAYVRADGTSFAPGLQVGLQPSWGDNVHVQAGATMLVISSGHARTTNQSGACGSNSCQENADGNPPPGFPQDNPSCPPSPDINDDVGLQVTIRAPTNATGYNFNFKFYSNEYPYYVCDSYNDQFIALVSPPPKGSLNGNISFDSLGNPVSVNLGFFNVCDPSQIGLYAFDCNQGGVGSCPSPPNPYCPSGTAELQGTGLDVWDNGFGNAGATSWLLSQAPVTGGSDVSIRFVMWDTGDQLFDSTTLIDNFQWIATKGTVTVGTMMQPSPQ
jgi:hypothetical protein